jgi:hypothetical protein
MGRKKRSAVSGQRSAFHSYSTLAIDEFKIAGVLAVETAARRTKPAALGSP